MSDEIEIGVQKLPDEVLRKFTCAARPPFGEILCLWNYRGDLTETGDRTLRGIMGGAKWEHYNWDTAVCNGRMLVVLPRFKHPQGIEPKFGCNFPADWFWCFGQMAEEKDVLVCESEASRVDDDLRELLSAIPGLEWMRILRVNFFSHGRGKAKAKHRPPPENMAFFRFPGGYGCTVAAARASTRARKAVAA